MAKRVLQEPIFVHTDEGVARMLNCLSRATCVAVDCEMDSFWSYWGRVCLVQLSDGVREWILDPLGVDLSCLNDLMGSAQTTKIFHDAEYDIRQLKRDAGLSFASIFDTRAAAAICGHASPGLGTILQERFGVAVNKKFQRADWTKRPLTRSMLSYAQSDVAYLHELKGLLEVDLDQLGRVPILETEHERLCAIERAADPYPVENYARIKGAAHLDGRERRRLRELYRARNEFAETCNRAPFRIVNNHVLIDLSKNPVYDEPSFAHVRGLNRRIATRIAKSMTSAMKLAEELEPIARNPPKNPLGLHARDRDRYDAIRKWRTKASKELGVEGSLLLRKEMAVTLSRLNPASLHDLAGVLAEWQVHLFAKELLQAIVSRRA